MFCCFGATSLRYSSQLVLEYVHGRTVDQYVLFDLDSDPFVCESKSISRRGIPP